MESEQDSERKGSAVTLWAFAVLATLGTVVVLAMVLGNLVPNMGPKKGAVVDGVDVEAMRHACTLARSELGMLCKKTGQVDEALHDKRCPAARAMARPVLESRESLGPLAHDLRTYVAARLRDTCDSG